MKARWSRSNDATGGLINSEVIGLSAVSLPGEGKMRFLASPIWLVVALFTAAGLLQAGAQLNNK